MKFKSLPVTSLEDATVDFEQLSARSILDSTAQNFPQLPSAKTLHLSTGFIGPTGTIGSGTGDFTVSHPSLGTYTVSNAAWPATYSVVVTPTETGGVLTGANVSAVGGGTFTVATFITNTGAGANTGFSFVVFY